MNIHHMPTIDIDAEGGVAMNCMTVIAGRAASATGHVLVGHNEDDPGHIVVRHGYVPARDWPQGACMPAEPGCASIPQVAHTLGFSWSQNVASTGGLSTADTMLNERGVLVCSNSMGGSREDGEDASLVTDGGIGFNLRRAIAERATSARDGVRVLLELVHAWGYASSGRAYTIADRDEAFMIQLVRGRHYLGARIPDDAVAVMPNHYTLHTLRDCPEMFYPDDLVAYAVERGWYAPAVPGDFSDFDFARAYQAPENQQNPRNVVRQVHGQRILLGREWDAAREGLHFCIRPEQKVTFEAMAAVMRTHYEGTVDDAERCGPGRSPHGTDVRRICTGTTIESVIVDFTDAVPLTAVYLAPGRPCQLPYLPLHPLCGMARPLRSMDDPAAALERHLIPDPAITQDARDAFSRMRGYESLCEMLYEDVRGDVRALVDALTQEALSAHAALMRDAAPLLARGDGDALRALVLRADEEAVLAALTRMEALAQRRFALAAIACDTAPATGDAPLSLVFACPGEPIEDTLVLGVTHTDLRQRHAHAVPGSLTRLSGGAWRAVFPREPFAPYIAAPGAYAFCLGGQLQGGGAFAGLVSIAFA